MTQIHATQYSARYAAPSVQQLLPFIVHELQEMGVAYHTCLCLPAYAEETPLEHVWSQTSLTRTSDATKNLVLIFGNWPENASQANINKTINSISRLTETNTLHCRAETTLKYQFIPATSGSIDILALWTTRGLPVKEGVGLARKMLMDLAVGLVENELILNPWIGNTDADAVLPIDYWDQLDQPQVPAGLLVFPFEHRIIDQTQVLIETDLDEANQKLMQAHRIYEHYLYQYRDALAQAMPEYAFCTLGSLYAIHSKAYQQIRGYPKRAAGEDFYLLNKMVKTAQVTQLEGNPILLRARTSARTPFGTGPSVSALLAEKDMHQIPFFYHPECLSIWVALLKSMQTSNPELWPESIPSQIRTKAIQQYDQCSSEKQKRNALISLIDGLRCQQLLRNLHQLYPRLSWAQLFNNE